MNGVLQHPRVRRKSVVTRPAERKLNIARVTGTSSQLSLTAMGELDAKRESQLIARMVNGPAARKGTPSDRLVPVGRALYSSIFILASFGHFSRATIDYAAHLGVPLATILVPVSGLMALIGGLSVMTGYRMRLGAALLILFLVPVTFTMHAFWAVHDPQMAELQRAMFFKNVALIGAALLLGYFGAGPYSLGARPTAE